MTLRLTLRQLVYPVAVAECGSVALVAGRLNVGSASNSAAITQARADRAPDGQRLVQVPIGGRVRPKRLGRMLPWRQPRRTVQEFLDQARKNVAEAQLPGLTEGAS